MLYREMLKNSEQIESYLVKSNGIGIVQLDVNLKIIDFNIGFIRLFKTIEPPTGKHLNFYLELGNRDLPCDVELKIPCSYNTGLNAVNSCYLIKTDNGFLLFCERMLLTESFALEQIGRINNDLVNLQRELIKKNIQLEKLQGELDTRIAELEESLARVKMLEGIIPICMFCKKIRDDKQSWHQLESYISEHSEAQFSHGMCPECFAKQIDQK